MQPFRFWWNGGDDDRTNNGCTESLWKWAHAVYTHTFDCICNVIHAYYMLKSKRSRRTWFLLQYLRRLFIQCITCVRDESMAWRRARCFHSFVHLFELRCFDVSAIACAAFSNIHFIRFPFFLSDSYQYAMKHLLFHLLSEFVDSPAYMQTIDSVEKIT